MQMPDPVTCYRCSICKEIKGEKPEDASDCECRHLKEAKKQVDEETMNYLVKMFDALWESTGAQKPREIMRKMLPFFDVEKMEEDE